jgi:hypothetical protein
MVGTVPCQDASPRDPHCVCADDASQVLAAELGAWHLGAKPVPYLQWTRSDLSLWAEMSRIVPTSEHQELMGITPVSSQFLTMYHRQGW